MPIKNEHWSGPDELIQKEIGVVVKSIEEDVPKTATNLSTKKSKSGGEKQEHWSGPDELLNK